MDPKNIEAARELLVEGLALQYVADKYGLTKQRALAIRDKLYAAYVQLPPDGWETATVCAPKDMLDQFLIKVGECRREIQNVRANNGTRVKKPK
ncbi:hypothetical protein GCM10009425_40490 [Pseudomonas asuensis]|uniref:TrfB transcriptional repressor protein domain-containing protein n=1 Tax=Pseudomonas asuensis TaxID=1825787 RepID=A0ABQ2H2J3_9PSED|nr:TrfB-related DNA-binding protein [Pseudomonas asuensis]GGM25629.1 hypothetical protein GCM10009425_40490 [Pseudomonas asuensis]